MTNITNTNSQIYLGASTSSSLVIGSHQNPNPFLAVSKDGVITTPLQPFFSACLSQTIHTPTNNQYQRLEANHIIENIGGHYNPTNAEFTSPKTGIYAFDAFVQSGETNLNYFVDITLRTVSQTEQSVINHITKCYSTFDHGLTCALNRMVKMSLGDKAFVEYKLGAIPNVDKAIWVYKMHLGTCGSGFSGYLLG